MASRPRSPLQLSILSTLAYAHVFETGLNLAELHRLLFTTKSTTLAQVSNELLRMNSVVQKQGFWVLKGEEKYADLAAQKREHAQRLLTHSSMIAQWLIKIPSVVGVFSTGSVAAGNAGLNDDLDFLVVTKAGTLWMTRILVVLLSKLFGTYQRVYHHPDPSMLFHASAETKARWCFNMWLDTSTLKVPVVSQNRYTAREVAQALPLSHKDDLVQQFMIQNLWITKVLANVSIPPRSVVGKGSMSARVPWLERVAYRLQTAYMRKHKTNESVSLHAAFFHPRDTATLVRERYEQMLKKHRLALKAAW